MSDELPKNGIIKLPILAPGRKDVYTCALNLQAFYSDLRNTLANNNLHRFSDMLGRPKEKRKGIFFEGEAKKGIQMDPGGNLNRTAALFERRLVWKEEADRIDFELVWEARAPGFYSKYGWYELKIDLVCRNLKNKEILVGNEKQTVQEGMWEFRNHLYYLNKIKLDFLDKIPFVKNNMRIQNLYYRHFYENTIELDHIEFGLKRLKPLINEVIKRHFT
jgi:hypothetical protein